MEHSVYPRCTQRATMEANTMQETALLELRGICKFFPGVRALDGVDFTLRKGEIHALMGENGAGKSTLIKVLTGVYSKDEGTISMEGTPVQIRTTQDALKAGISTVYQEITLCPNLTVAENLYIGKPKSPPTPKSAPASSCRGPLWPPTCGITLTATRPQPKPTNASPPRCWATTGAWTKPA